jgi:hypothetical protein
MEDRAPCIYQCRFTWTYDSRNRKIIRGPHHFRHKGERAEGDYSCLVM